MISLQDVCMPDMKAVDMDTMSWECIVADGTKGRSAVKQHLKAEEDVISATKTFTLPHLSLQPQSTLLHPSRKLIKLKTSNRIRPGI